MSELAPGTVVAGRYVISRLLGRGAMKVVYLAHEAQSGTPVAFALLGEDTRDDPVVGARFSREGRAASALRSPHVVRVYDVGKLPDGNRYIVTEAVLGRSLADAIEYGALAPELAIRWTLQVLTALEEAHARGVLHRDVKPENVLLAPSPDGETAKLTDFGLAKVLDGTLEGSVLLHTAQNAVLGTPDYMPPEQWQGLPVDARADLYATGAMLYELLSGRPPFEARALHEFCVAHLFQAPARFPEDAPRLLRAVEPVVLKALEKKPEDRFSSALAMRIALEEATGIRLANASRAVPSLPPPPLTKPQRAEFLCDVLPGLLQVMPGESLTLGRDPECDVLVRCLPPGSEAQHRERGISRRHAKVSVQGAQVSLVDLGSRAGTLLVGMTVGAEPMPLRHGDEFSLGRHLRYQVQIGRGPDRSVWWVKLTRTDELGGGQAHLLVVVEAKISAATDAAVPLPAAMAAGDVLRILRADRHMEIASLGAPDSVPLRDGQTLRVGGVLLSVALE